MFVTKMEGKVRTDGCKHTHEHTHLCLNVKRDEPVCDQVVDGLKPLLSNKVFSIMVETEVSRLVPKPGMEDRVKREKLALFYSYFVFYVSCML